jgi:hypothetical protein
MEGKLNCDELEFHPSEFIPIEQQLCGYFELRYKSELKRAASKAGKLLKQGLSFSAEVWNEHIQQEMINVSNYFGDYTIARNFLRYISGEDFKCVKIPMKDRSPSLNYLF